MRALTSPIIASGQIAGAPAHIFIDNVVHNAEECSVITTYLRMPGAMPSSSALDTRQGR